MSFRCIRVCTLAALALALLVPSLATAATPPSLDVGVTPGTSERTASASSRPATRAVKVFAAPLPGMYVAGGRVTVLDGNGTEIGSAITNRLGTAEVEIAGAAGSGPFTVSVRGGTLRYAVEGDYRSIPFTGESQARASRIDAAAPVVIVDVVSTSAFALVEQGRLPYTQALDASQRALGVPVRAPAYTTAFFNWDVSGIKLLSAAKRQGGYDELITEIADAAARGGRLAGDLEPERSRSAVQPDESLSETGRTQDSSAAMQVRNANVANSCIGGTAGAGNANGTAPSGAGFDLGTIPGYKDYSPNRIDNMATGATLGLLKYTAGPIGEALGPILIGTIFGSGISAERQMLETVLDNQRIMGRHLDRILQNQQAIATQLNCITTQLGQLESNLSIEISTEGSRTCVAQIDSGWNLYQFLVRNASKESPLDLTNPSVQNAATTWNSQLSHCGALVDTMLFGRNAQDTGEGTWAKILRKYTNIANEKQDGAFTPPQIQALQAYLAYWGAIQYRSLVLVTEANRLLNIPQNTLALIGADTSGQCPTATASATYCRFTNNMKTASPSDLLSNELGISTCPDPGSAGRGCAVSATPGGLGIAPYHQAGTTPTAERALALNDRNLNRACIKWQPSLAPWLVNGALVPGNWEYTVQYNCTDSGDLRGSTESPHFGVVYGGSGRGVVWSQWFGLQNSQEPPIGPQLNPSQSFAQNAIQATRMMVENGSANALPQSVATWKSPKEPRVAIPFSAYGSAIFGDFASTFYGAAFKSAGSELAAKMHYLPATPILVAPSGLYGGVNSATPTWSSVGGSRVYSIDCLRRQETPNCTFRKDEYGNVERNGIPFSAMDGEPAATTSSMPIRHRQRGPYLGVPVVNCPGSTCPEGRTYSFLVHGAWKAALPVVNVVSDSWTPPPITVPAAPEKPSLTASVGRIVVDWSPPWSNGRSRITGYTATTSGGATCTTNSATTTTCSIAGLENNTTHAVTVTATNAIGTSSASAPSTVAMPTPPGAPDAPLLTASLGRINVAWAKPKADGGAAITGYTATAASGATCTTLSATTKCSIVGLENNTTHTVTVTATNAVGTSSASAPSTVAMPTPPGAPDAPLLTAFIGRIDVAWAEPQEDGGAAITGYTATALPGGATCTTTTENECTIGNLEGDTTYTVTVAATNGVGTGPASEASTAITPITPVVLLKPDVGSFGSGVTLVPQAVKPTGAVSPSGALTISGFNLTPRTLLPGIGSNITYTLNKPATVTLTFTHSGDRARSSRVVYRMAAGRPGAVAGPTRIRLLYADASAARKEAGIWKVRIEARTANGMVATRTISIRVQTTTS